MADLILDNKIINNSNIDFHKYNFNIVSDVNNPLLGKNGATYMFSKQKGAKNKETIYNFKVYEMDIFYQDEDLKHWDYEIYENQVLSLNIKYNEDKISSGYSNR